MSARILSHPSSRLRDERERERKARATDRTYILNLLGLRIEQMKWLAERLQALPLDAWTPSLNRLAPYPAIADPERDEKAGRAVEHRGAINYFIDTFSWRSVPNLLVWNGFGLLREPQPLTFLDAMATFVEEQERVGRMGTWGGRHVDS